MVLRAENPTMPYGERAWFVKVVKSGEGDVPVWAMIRPFDDGSAALRTASDMKTYAPPNGPSDALARIEQEGFVELTKARALGIVSAEAEPPKW